MKNINGNISTEQKLQLAQMIRAENQDNRMKMKNRERMLYGINSKAEAEELPLYTRGYYNGYLEKGGKELYAADDGSEAVQHTSFSSFKIRLVCALFLFAAFLFLNSGSGNVAGITTKEIQEEINKDFDEGLNSIIFDFEHNFPYTLFDTNK